MTPLHFTSGEQIVLCVVVGDTFESKGVTPVTQAVTQGVLNEYKNKRKRC